MDRQDLPLGFGFALAMNPEAMKKFSGLPESRQAEIIQKAHGVSSKSEMQSLVNQLTAGD